MEALLNSLVVNLAAHPGWLFGIIALLVVGLSAKLILSNPKFWEITQHSLTQNTKLTEETLATVKLIAERQTSIKSSVDAHDDLLCRVIDDVDALSKEVSRLHKASCSNEECPVRAKVA